ncbi:MAG: DUF4160 domain-containing protein [Magnetococcales bacterium]|nr:DUF4160 domain-containing protein [Magnetococcales bacterium]MBF0149535.1 DUF4160 domain-containing protein [Magnetococcales bacterium]MBF0174318.1 DUF4160 domain-containing protein [Magnetococcales bacterium]MBF0348335.1 DUF4160 domain-containing protein [Magnetococcales bacterium]MBF0633017.1 DUF4160 domain-containing protein [Magnetococcales bacterium]
MPTVLRHGGYRFYFYSHEPNEPAHVHVDKDGNSAKFWISPLQLSSNIGYSAKDLSEVRKIIQQNSHTLMEAWHGYFGPSSR